MLSSGTTNIDSVTRFGDYIEQAKKDGLYNVTISEHGNIYEWYHKKQAIESAGFKYIHAVEAYITENPDEKVRDNYVSTPHLEQHHPITARCRVSASAQFKSCRTHSAAASVSLLCLISIWITRLSQLQRRNLLFCRLL